MGMFDKIRNALMHRRHATPIADHDAGHQAPQQGNWNASNAAPSSTGQNADLSAAAPSSPSPVGGMGSAPANAKQDVDIEPILDEAVKKHGGKLDWRHSIVDFMKALDLDSGLEARKELAADLNYDGDTQDSAKMNMWLHKALMKKLAENGGKVPQELTA